MTAAFPFSLHRNAHGRLVHVDTATGREVDGVTPVRAFPLADPGAHVSLVGPDGHELAWIERLQALPPAVRALVDEELAERDLMPQILRLRAVSTFSTPSTWTVETDRGETTLVLKGEEDIRRLSERGRLLVTSGHGQVFEIRDLTAMDRHSKRLLERFL